MPRSEADEPRLRSDEEVDVEGHSLGEPRLAEAEGEEPRGAQDEGEEPDVEAHSPRMSPRMQPRS